jgi:hypothetical protein
LKGRGTAQPGLVIWKDEESDTNGRNLTSPASTTVPSSQERSVICLHHLEKPRQDLGNSNVQYPLQKEMILLKLFNKKFYRGLGAFCVEHHKNGCCCHRLY